jgi:NADPH-dependent curcumin reductase CurA
MSLPTTMNTQVLLAQRPTSLPDAKTFKIVQTPIPTTLGDNQILIQTLYISLDPAMRGWMNDQKSYVPPVPINGVMRAGGMLYIHILRSFQNISYVISDAHIDW